MKLRIDQLPEKMSLRRLIYRLVREGWTVYHSNGKRFEDVRPTVVWLRPSPAAPHDVLATTLEIRTDCNNQTVAARLGYLAGNVEFTGHVGDLRRKKNTKGWAELSDFVDMMKRLKDCSVPEIGKLPEDAATSDVDWLREELIRVDEDRGRLEDRAYRAEQALGREVARHDPRMNDIFRDGAVMLFRGIWRGRGMQPQNIARPGLLARVWKVVTRW